MALTSIHNCLELEIGQFAFRENVRGHGEVVGDIGGFDAGQGGVFDDWVGMVAAVGEFFGAVGRVCDFLLVLQSIFLIVHLVLLGRGLAIPRFVLRGVGRPSCSRVCHGGHLLEHSLCGGVARGGQVGECLGG